MLEFSQPMTIKETAGAATIHYYLFFANKQLIKKKSYIEQELIINTSSSRSKDGSFSIT